MNVIELEQQAVSLRLSQLETKKKIFELLEPFAKQKMWKNMGYKSFPHYCRVVLDFTVDEVRDLQRHLGMILPTSKIVSDDPTIQERIDKLKVWRRIKATSVGVPSYLILSNKTLFEVAKTGPKTLDDLSKISGIGERKIQNLGNEMLKTINY